MFNVGGGELIVILLIALIVLGPARLPDAARQVARTVGELKRLSNGFQREVRAAFDADQVSPGSSSSPGSGPREATPPTSIPRRIGEAVSDVSDQAEPSEPARGDEPPTDA